MAKRKRYRLDFHFCRPCVHFLSCNICLKIPLLSAIECQCTVKCQTILNLLHPLPLQKPSRPLPQGEDTTSSSILAGLFLYLNMF
jgi:hypothetical protein